MKREVSTEAIRSVAVVHRGPELLVLHKPAGMTTTAPDASPHVCLTDVAHHIDPEAPRLHPSSRLDLDVSGLVTFARTRLATHSLLEARQSGQYLRTYIGISVGSLASIEGSWNDAIGIDPQNPKLRTAVISKKTKGTKAATTRYKVLEQAAHGILLRLRPETGRTHQLRVHAAHNQVPLFGDKSYGGSARVTLANGRMLSARRVMLHCLSVSLPKIGEQLGPYDFIAEPPEDFLKCLASLGLQAAIRDQSLRHLAE